MMVRRIGRRVVGIAAIVLIAGIAAAAVATRNLRSGKTGGPLQAVSAPADVVARGKYLAEAADCAACHTAPGGAPYAGGLAMPSGFGTIYATNITPEPDDGIGRWSAEDFWRALHDGIRRDGRQLYPAMPYTSYRGMTRADADAIYAYVMQLLPMKVANRRTELNFPFNIRLGMLGWNVLFLHDSLPAVSAGSSPAWQRGRYLVNVLGHCGECHTPRGIAGEMELSRALTGFALSLTAEDSVAIYLLGDNPPPPAPLPATDATESAAASAAGRMSYVALCAGCHGLDGNGMPNTVVAMRNNSTLRLADPRNLIVAMLDGIGAENFPHHASMQAMPGFSDKLSDADAAALANYLRVTWGGQKGDVTPAAVRALR
jgi:mono/diheme cytochrome c family protein